MKNFLFLLVLIPFLFSCSVKRTQPIDLKTLPQDPFAYIDKKRANKPLINPELMTLIDKKYNKKFFKPWDRKRAGYRKKDVLWGFRVYSRKTGFGENKQKHPKDWLKKLKQDADLDTYPNFNKKGIIVKNTDLRVLPTEKPFFYDFNLAGEGYPFDYFQNSAVYAGTPVFISHLSKNKDWYLVETPFALGWVKVDDVAIVDQEFIDNYKRESFIAFIKDNIPVNDSEGNFRFYGKIGSVFPIVQKKEKSFQIYIPVRDYDGYGIIETATVSKKDSVKKPLLPTLNNFAKIAKELINKPYGWGGYLMNRDCSALVKDFYTPFGIWMPRNSTAQAKNGIFVPLKDLQPYQKEKIIKEMAVPYLTLVWMRGHIMIYIGKKDGEPLIFHSFWGIKTRSYLNKEGRFVVGKSAITTLKPEKGVWLVDFKGKFLNRIQGITILFPPKYMN